MRFKVGDKVRFNYNSKKYIGTVVETNTGQKKDCYLIKIPGFNGHDGLEWSLHGPYPTDEYRYLFESEVSSYQLAIKELEGKVIVLRNGSRYFVYADKDGKFWAADYYKFITLSTYNDDLTYSGSGEFDIIEVRELKIGYLSEIIRGSEIIWKGNELKKMTKKEIEKQLGYRIEIVEENK